jgi:hypothetical protein
LTCIRFCEMYPEDSDNMVLAEVSYRKMLCNYLCACVGSMAARMESNIEEKLQYYLDVRRHIQEFRAKKDSIMQDKPDKETEDLKKKFALLLGYDFEAAVWLEDWDSLRSLVEEAEPVTTANSIFVFEIMTDITICSEAPNRVKLIVMQTILNNTVRSPIMDIVKLSRWIRTLMNLSIHREPKIAEALLTEVLDIVKNRDEKQYPDDELQWLSGIFFQSNSFSYH